MLPDVPRPALVAYDNAPKDPSAHTPEEIADRLVTLGASIPHADVRARSPRKTCGSRGTRAVDDPDEFGE